MEGDEEEGRGGKGRWRRDNGGGRREEYISHLRYTCAATMYIYIYI
jgi:hypothetical protein